MTQWVYEAAIAAIETTEGVVEDNRLTETGLNIAARTVAAIFPGAILFLLTTGCVGIFGLFVRYTELSTQVRAQNEFNRESLATLQESYKEMKARQDALDDDLRKLTERIIRLE